MALSRRNGQRFQGAIWPGFVDAMTGLLLVLMFVLTIFMVVQFVLRETITGQELELGELTREVAALAEALGLEQDKSATLATQVGSLTDALGEARDGAEAQAQLIDRLTRERDATAAALSDAKTRITGFEARVAGLLADRDVDRAAIADLEATRAELISEREAQNLALARARDEIDAEAEAARLAAARADALDALVADLQTSADKSDARIGSLTSQIADLEAAASESRTEIDALEADRLAEAAAAEALRQKLENADAELTAMTLALEEQRQEAEDTLTLLAAAERAREEATTDLAAALLAKQQAQDELGSLRDTEAELDARLVAALAARQVSESELADARTALAAAEGQTADLTTRLAAALSARSDVEADLAELQTALEEEKADAAEIQERLAAAVLAQQAAQAEAGTLEDELARALAQAFAAEAAADRAIAGQADLEDRLAEALLARESLETRVESLSKTAAETDQARADIEAQLAEALAAHNASDAALLETRTEADQHAAALEAARLRLSEEEQLSARAQRQVAALNEQVADLRSKVGQLQELLNLSEVTDREAQVEITALGEKLNAALARVAQEERARAALEEAERRRLQEERDRLAAEAEDLERYRSDFFGKMREILAGQEGVRVVGDRFVFSSEVLFNPGSADLSADGRAQIASIAQTLRELSQSIPDVIDWVIRVDGHTDDTQLSGRGEFADNWELSQARALSVVRYMTGALGFPPNRLAANGFAEFHPIAEGNSEAARAANRRIELKLTER